MCVCVCSGCVSGYGPGDGRVCVVVCRHDRWQRYGQGEGEGGVAPGPMSTDRKYPHLTMLDAASGLL